MHKREPDLQEPVIFFPVRLDQLIEKIEVCIEKKLQEKQFKELQEKLFSPAETCKLFQPSISKPTLRSWVNQGLIPEYRIGGRVYYRYRELMESVKAIKRYKK